jgi:hypothetical protein
MGKTLIGLIDGVLVRRIGSIAYVIDIECSEEG